MITEIDQALVALLAGDATLMTYLGGTVADNRIYGWSPPTDIVYQEGVTDASILYHFSFSGRGSSWSYPKQMPDQQLFLRVLSLTQSKLRLITEKLIAENFIDKTSITTTNWSVKWITLLSASDGLNEGAPTKPLLVRNFSFRFSNLFRRT